RRMSVPRLLRVSPALAHAAGGNGRRGHHDARDPKLRHLARWRRRPLAERHRVLWEQRPGDSFLLGPGSEPVPVKAPLVLAVFFLAVTASFASAAGLQLGWSNDIGPGTCPFSSLAGVDYTDPCDGTGFQYLVGAFQAPAGLTQVTDEYAWVSMLSYDPNLPPFWRLENGGCGEGAILMEAVFTRWATGTTATTCRDYSGTSASGYFVWGSAYSGPNGARLTGVFSRPAETATRMV